LCILLSSLGMRAHKITKKQGQLLGKAASTPNMDMGTALLWGLTKIAFGKIAVFRMKNVAQTLQRYTEGIERLKIGGRVIY
jgi:hypothetical protein